MTACQLFIPSSVAPNYLFFIEHHFQVVWWVPEVTVFNSVLVNACSRLAKCSSSSGFLNLSVRDRSVSGKGPQGWQDGPLSSVSSDSTRTISHFCKAFPKACCSWSWNSKHHNWNRGVFLQMGRWVLCSICVQNLLSTNFPAEFSLLCTALNSSSLR